MENITRSQICGNKCRAADNPHKPAVSLTCNMIRAELDGDGGAGEGAGHGRAEAVTIAVVIMTLYIIRTTFKVIMVINFRDNIDEVRNLISNI